MSIDFLEGNHIVSAFVPVADAFAGAIATDAVSLEHYAQATLVIMTGAVEDAAVSNLVKIVASTTNATTGGTNMAFRHRVVASSTTVDQWGIIVDATSSGFNFSDPNSDANTMWYCTVTADEVSSALDGAKFVYADIDETVDKTITAGGIWILSNPRYMETQPVSAIA